MEALLRTVDELKEEIRILKLKVEKLMPRHSFLSLPKRQYTEEDYFE